MALAVPLAQIEQIFHAEYARAVGLAESKGPRQRSPPSTPSTWIAIICSTLSALTCCVVWAAYLKRQQPTTPLSSRIRNTVEQAFLRHRCRELAPPVG
jgi:hypothetical protein